MHVCTYVFYCVGSSIQAHNYLLLLWGILNCIFVISYDLLIFFNKVMSLSFYLHFVSNILLIAYFATVESLSTCTYSLLAINPKSSCNMQQNLAHDELVLTVSS